MKLHLNALPAWVKVLIFFLVLWLATLTAGKIPALNDFVFFFAVSLILSWTLSNERNHLFQSLGFLPIKKKDYLNCFKGLAIGILMLIATAIITLMLTGDKWRWEKHIDPIYIAITFLTCLWSAFVQEFVFRGYPFQLLLQKYRPWIAQAIIAIPFGLMHLHHQMTFMDMACIMLTTGLGAVLFGLAYIRTKKMYFSISLHLGWNFAQVLIPRTAGAEQAGLIKIINHHDYERFEIIGPYLLIVLVTIALFYLPKSFGCQTCNAAPSKLS